LRAILPRYGPSCSCFERWLIGLPCDNPKHLGR
jgi:hypothetical protein